MKYIYILQSLMMYSLGLYAQDYNYVRYGVKDGLPGSVVYNMAQDKDGFIWFGTESGLSRFDGTRFTNFTTEDGLPDNEILKLFVDSKNRIWIIPFKNAICYYWRGKIYNKDNDSLLKKISIEQRVIAVKENLQGDIFILEQTKLYIISSNGQIREIGECAGLPIFHSFAAGFDNSGNLRMAGILSKTRESRTYGEFCLCELKGDTLFLKENISEYRPNSEKTVYLSPELDFICKKNNLLFFYHRTGDFHSLSLPEGYINLTRVNDSLIAVSTNEYCRIYNVFQQKYSQLIFKKKNVSSVLEDKEGNLWFATLGNGVYRLVSLRVRSYKFGEDDRDQPVYALLKSGDTLFAGSDKFNLWSVNLINHQVSYKRLWDMLDVGKITSVNILPNGNLLVGSGVALTVSGGKVSRFDELLVTIKSVQLCSDTILIGALSGAYRIIPGTPGRWDTLWNGRVTTIYRQPPFFYVGTLNGLYIIDEEGKINWLGTLHNALKSRIAAISAGRDGTVWIATHGAGVIGYKNNKVVTSLTRQNGLTSNSCTALFVQDSILWIGTNKGLNKVIFEGKKSHITHYTYTDGLASDVINAIAVEDETIYVATSEGVTFFKDSNLSENSMCVLKITGINSAGQYWTFDTTNLHFRHSDNNIRIDFSGISFKSAGDITYSYRMLGIDEDWSTTKEQFLTYQALPSGDYTLQLMATNKFGVRSELKEISFTIEKLIWEKNWFRLLALSAMVFLVWYFVSMRIKKIRRIDAEKADTNRKIAELEQMALKAQMNPHFIFNSLNSIQHYVIQNDVKGANKFIADFSRLIRLTLDISSKPKISLDDEMNYVSIYLSLEQKRFERKFNYIIQADKNIDAPDYYIPAMILQPYIENSIRHGIRYREDDRGKIIVAFYMEQGYLVCTITDNGVGRAFSKQVKGRVNIEYQSKGMSLTARRIEMMNKNQVMPTYVNVEDLYDDEGNSLGTKVIIRFPEKEIKKPV